MICNDGKPCLQAGGARKANHCARTGMSAGRPFVTNIALKNNPPTNLPPPQAHPPHRGMAGVLASALAGCTSSPQAPAFLVLDSYFPSWLVGALAAFVVTVIFRALLIKTGVDDWIPARFWVYIAFWLSVSIAISYLYSPR